MKDRDFEDDDEDCYFIEKIFVCNDDESDDNNINIDRGDEIEEEWDRYELLYNDVIS